MQELYVIYFLGFVSSSLFMLAALVWVVPTVQNLKVCDNQVIP